MARPPDDSLPGGAAWVEVACALPQRQKVVRLELPAGGLTAGEAWRSSRLAGDFPELGPAMPPLGIFGVPCDPTRPLRPGDRVEVYRPLRNDPRDARRARVAGARSKGATRR